MHHAPAPLARLTIARDPRGGWRVAREAGTDPARILLGRTPGEAGRLAPLVFNLCGAAHGLAAATALGLEADAAALARRMAQETARDHARAILVDWPQALGEAPDRASLGLIARPDGASSLVTALAGTTADMAAFSLSELEAWLAEGATGTARHLACLRAEVDPAEGRAALPPLTEADLASTLSPSGADAIAAPGGTPSFHRETGPLAHMAGTPVLADLLAKEGPSLFARLLARLLDCLAALRGAASPAGAHRPGVGLAHAARGLLGHAARVENGRVASYRVLSPSTWNLAPGGLMDRAFAALSCGPQAERLAPLLVSAINPCVPVTLMTEAHAHA